MKHLILFIIPWTLLFGCSEPENGGGRVQGGDKTCVDQCVTLPGKDSSAVHAPTNKKAGSSTGSEHRIVDPKVAGSIPVQPVTKPKPKTYGGYTIPELIDALYAIESTKGRNKNRRGVVRGRGGERGPFQFTRLTWHFVNWHLTKRKWSFSRADSYYYSEKAAYTYMRYLIKRFTKRSPDRRYQAWQLAMLGWNGGPTKVAKGRTPKNAFRFLELITKYLKTGWYYGIKD